MLVTLNEVLRDAQKNKYAVGLFNTVNYEMAMGVIAAAEEANAPVIIGTAEVLLTASDLDSLAPLLTAAAKRAKAPVVLHFDHGLSEDKIRKAIDLGFSSIMYDCSGLDYEHNLRAVAEMTAYAHQRGVTVEGELGHVGANENAAEAAQADVSIYTEPDKAEDFAAQTGIDALAVAFGTAHGVYKSAPKLDFERLSEIAARTPVPLVLHGGSGLSDEDFRQSIACGISKVNIFTDINMAAAKAAYDGYRDGIGMTELMPQIIQAIKEATLRKMRLFGCCGRA